MQHCSCPYIHRCRNCARTAPCHANYCSEHCYRQDRARNFRPLPAGGPPPEAPPARPPKFTRIW